jgi:hypothetical protein
VKNNPALVVAEAVGDTTTYLREHKCETAPGAVLWKRLLEIAGARGVRIKAPGR